MLLFNAVCYCIGTLFGQTQTSTSGGGGFGGFGQANTNFGASTSQQSGGLFNKPTAFGQPTTQANSGFNFGNTSQAGGLFGANKPPTTNAGFGFQSTGFGNAQSGGGLFNSNKGAFGTGLGSGSSFGAGTTLGAGLGNTGLFSGQKPNLGGLNTGFGGGVGFGGIGGGSGLNMGANTTLGTAPDANLQNAQVQQQLMALATSPYGDSPLFRNISSDLGKREELIKPTSIAAQKAALANSAQFKVSPRPTAKIKPKPLHSLANGKAQIFEGLEDDETSFGNDSFIPRRSLKKLVIKNSDRSNQSSFNGSVLDGSQVGNGEISPQVDPFSHGDTASRVSNTTPQL